MTNDTTYNGWRNYATWRINSDIFDGQSPEDVTGDMAAEVSDLADALKEYAEALAACASSEHRWGLGWIETGSSEDLAGSSEDLARSYALAFLSDVDWREIAQGMADAYADERTEAEAA